MADVSKFQDMDGVEYNLVDAGAVHTVDSSLSSTSENPVQNKVVNAALNGKANAASVTGATKCKVTYNSQGVITAGANLAASDIPNLVASKITSGTFDDERIASASKWNAKQDALTQGTNITISGNTISATDTTYAYVTPEVIVEILNAMQVSD